MIAVSTSQGIIYVDVLDRGSMGPAGPQGPPGEQGEPGGSTSVFEFKAKTNSFSGDPGTGNILWSNPIQINSTYLNFNKFSSSGLDVTIGLQSIEPGDVFYLQEKGNNVNFQKWEVVSTTQQISYFTFNVLLIESNGDATTNFSNNTVLAMQVIRVGVGAGDADPHEGLIVHAWGGKKRIFAFDGRGMEETVAFSLADTMVHYAAVWVPGVKTLRYFSYFLITPGVFEPDNFNGFGLYQFDLGAGIYNLVATSNNDPDMWKGAFGWRDTPFATPYVASGAYMIAQLWNMSTNTTTPTVGAAPIVGSNSIPTMGLPFSNRLTGRKALQADFTPTLVPSTIAATTGKPLFAVSE